jgi:hypothetical protein
MFNQKLCDSIRSNKKRFEELGMEYHECQDNDGRGAYYGYKENGYEITIDAWYQVSLGKADRDSIEVVIDDLFDLEQLFDFIKKD